MAKYRVYRSGEDEPVRVVGGYADRVAPPLERPEAIAMLGLARDHPVMARVRGVQAHRRLEIAHDLGVLSHRVKRRDVALSPTAQNQPPRLDHGRSIA